MKIRQLSKHLCGCRPRCTMKSLPVLNTAFRSSTPGFASLYRQVSNSPPLWDIWRPEPSMRICNLHGEFQKIPSPLSSEKSARPSVMNMLLKWWLHPRRLCSGAPSPTVLWRDGTSPIPLLPLTESTSLLGSLRKAEHFTTTTKVFSR